MTARDASVCRVSKWRHAHVSGVRGRGVISFSNGPDMTWHVGISVPRCYRNGEAAQSVDRGAGGGGGSDVLDPNGSGENWVCVNYEPIRPCCTALPPGPRPRRPANPAVASPGAPTPARSSPPRPVRLLGARALLLDPHPPRIRGLRRRLRVLPANPTHRRTGHARGAARAVAADAVTGTGALRTRVGLCGSGRFNA